MPELTWDPVERPYEAGVDRAVLYLDTGAGVAWNGIVSVDDTVSGGEIESYYLDGEKYLDIVNGEDTSLTISAITYPDEFSDYDGYQDVLDKQGRRLFGFSYRTNNGDSYKLHLVYNCTAIPTDKAWETTQETTEPMLFGWTVVTVPVEVQGAKPTAHLVIDASEVSPGVLTQLEAIMYGEDLDVPGDGNEQIVDGGSPGVSTPDTVDGGNAMASFGSEIDGGGPASSGSSIGNGYARLPQVNEVLELFARNATFIVTDHGDGSWTATGDDDIVYFTDATSFEINWPLAIYSDAETYSIRSS